MPSIQFLSRTEDNNICPPARPFCDDNRFNPEDEQPIPSITDQSTKPFAKDLTKYAGLFILVALICVSFTLWLSWAKWPRKKVTALWNLRKRDKGIRSPKPRVRKEKPAAAAAVKRGDSYPNLVSALEEDLAMMEIDLDMDEVELKKKTRAEPMEKGVANFESFKLPVINAVDHSSPIHASAQPTIDMFIFQRATKTFLTPDAFAAEDALSQESEFASMGPSGKDIAEIVGISAAVMVALVFAMFLFHRTYLCYRRRRCEKPLLSEGIRKSESMPLKEQDEEFIGEDMSEYKIYYIIMDGPFTLVQSSTSQSSLPFLRRLLADETNPILLFCLLYPPTSLIGGRSSRERVKVFDWTEKVPGYAQDHSLAVDLLAAVKDVSGPTTIVIDSLDTLASDMASTLGAYDLLSKLRSVPSARLVIHAVNPPIESSLNLLPIITQTSFSSTLTHAIVHPIALLLHMSLNYLCPPPPLSPAPKFWSIFIPISERFHETGKLVFGTNGSGNSVNDDEFVVELLVRGGSTDGGRKKRSVERTLHGWNTIRGLCELKDLESLSSLWSTNKPSTKKDAPPADPTKNLSFNLNLTDSQQAARAQVPLPYAHQGEDPSAQSPRGAIFYDPDSADDIDDDDPDEDLDI